MKQILNHIKNNVLIKIASLNTLSIFIKVISGFVASKFIAIFIGAEGLALIGNFRNFSMSIRSFSTLGLSNGIVKYVAEFKSDLLELGKLVSTVFYLLFFSTTLIAIGCFIYAQELNHFIFTEHHNYSYIIKLLAIMLPFASASVLLFSLLNGFARFKSILWINILGQILITILSVILIWKKNIDGALIATAIAEVVLFVLLVLHVYNKHRSLRLVKFKAIDLRFVNRLSSYSIMALFTAIFLPLAMVGIRNYIIDTIGQEQAGFWEAMNRISNYYLMFISSLLTLYILPRFSELTTTSEFRKEVFDFYKTIIPIFAIGLILIYFLRYFIIGLVFTEAFYPAEILFSWQLLGDFVKVLSLVISYQFLAKRMVWHYLITEALSIGILYFSSIYFIDLYGLKGAPIGHFVTYLIYYFVIVLVFGKSLFGKLKSS